MLKVEPMARFKRDDDSGYTVSCDSLGQVAPPHWENAQNWPGLGTVNRFCQACKSIKLQVKRSAKLVVTTCTCATLGCRHLDNRRDLPPKPKPKDLLCGYGHPDAKATQECVVRAQEDWIRRGLARIEHDDEGKPIGVHMPSHSDVDDAESLAKMVASGEVPS
jgi:hypothetical protein